MAHRSRVSVDEWLRYGRSNRPRLRKQPGWSARRCRNGIKEAFSL